MTTEADRRRLAELCGYDLDEYTLRTWWHPDESIEQAMMVAEAMIKKGFPFMLRDWYGKEWLVTLNDEKLIDGKGKTPAEAICAAALAALNHSSDSIAPPGQNGTTPPKP